MTGVRLRMYIAETPVLRKTCPAETGPQGSEKEWPQQTEKDPSPETAT